MAGLLRWKAEYLTADERYMLTNVAERSVQLAPFPDGVTLAEIRKPEYQADMMQTSLQ